MRLEFPAVDDVYTLAVLQSERWHQVETLAVHDGQSAPSKRAAAIKWLVVKSYTTYPYIS